MTPGELFIVLWTRVVPHAGPVIEIPWQGRSAPEFNDIVRILADCDDRDVPKEIHAYLTRKAVSFACAVGEADQRAFVVMCALDHCAMFIHPAMPRRLPGMATGIKGMLAAMRSDRTSTGCYADVAGEGMVVPKGHLMDRRRPDDVQDASGTDLANQFGYLSLVRPLRDGPKLRFVVPQPSRFDLPADRAMHVGLAPIAQDPDDLQFRTAERGGSVYLDTLPAAPLLSKRIDETVCAMLDAGAGLVVLPELITAPSAVASLQGRLNARLGAPTPALILAGTGPSGTPSPGGRPYNEAVLMTADGRVLSIQRKLHLFRMDAGRMKDCGIAREAGYDDRNHLEDAAAGTELVVLDLHGLGRVMVLICEDLQQQTPGGDIALAIRPDWILTPVLDISQAVGRWTHARAIEVGRKTGSRIVVSCSATLAVRMAGAASLAAVAGESIQTGICFDGYENQRVHFVKTVAQATANFEVVRWDSTSWPRHMTTFRS